MPVQLNWHWQVEFVICLIIWTKGTEKKVIRKSKWIQGREKKTTGETATNFLYRVASLIPQVKSNAMLSQSEEDNMWLQIFCSYSKIAALRCSTQHSCKKAVELIMQDGPDLIMTLPKVIKTFLNLVVNLCRLWCFMVKTATTAVMYPYAGVVVSDETMRWGGGVFLPTYTVTSVLKM